MIYLVSSRNRPAAVISVPPSLQKPLTLISIHFRKKEKNEKRKF